MNSHQSWGSTWWWVLGIDVGVDRGCMPWSLRIPPKPPPPLHPFHSPPQGGVPSPIGYPSLFYPLFESMRRYVNPVISHQTLLVLSIKVECTCDDKSYAMVTRSLKIVTVVSNRITFSLKMKIDIVLKLIKHSIIEQ